MQHLLCLTHDSSGYRSRSGIPLLLSNSTTAGVCLLLSHISSPHGAIVFPAELAAYKTAEGVVQNLAHLSSNQETSFGLCTLVRTALTQSGGLTCRHYTLAQYEAMANHAQQQVFGSSGSLPASLVEVCLKLLLSRAFEHCYPAVNNALMLAPACKRSPGILEIMTRSSMQARHPLYPVLRWSHM